jgi:acyl carrier protein
MQKVQGDRVRPTREELLVMFCETASEVVEKDFHSVVEPTVISELAIDSLGMLEIIGSLERRLRIQIPDEGLAGVETIHDLLNEVEKRLA